MVVLKQHTLLHNKTNNYIFYISACSNQIKDNKGDGLKLASYLLVVGSVSDCPYKATRQTTCYHARNCLL
jgi:hypothetical protein